MPIAPSKIWVTGWWDRISGKIHLEYASRHRTIADVAREDLAQRLKEEPHKRVFLREVLFEEVKVGSTTAG